MLGDSSNLTYQLEEQLPRCELIYITTKLLSLTINKYYYYYYYYSTYKILLSSSYKLDFENVQILILIFYYRASLSTLLEREQACLLSDNKAEILLRPSPTTVGVLEVKVLGVNIVDSSSKPFTIFITDKGLCRFSFLDWIF